MNYYFDDDAQKLIVYAKDEMFNLRHPYVGSEHLFLAILKSEDLSVTKMLNSYGIFYTLFREELIKVVGVGSKTNKWFLFTPLLKKIINNAVNYSAGGDYGVTAFGLLLAILKDGDGVANRILQGMDVDLEALYDKVLIDNGVSKSCNLTMLNQYGVNMIDIDNVHSFNPVIGREEQLNIIMQSLLRKNKNSVLLIGDAGVGKTAIVEELASRIARGHVPYLLKDKTIYNVSIASLVAGTKYRGEFEEKLNKIVREIHDNRNIILFIDEIHTIIGAGGADGAIDAANILKPYLARGEITIIGATTLAEYEKSIKKDKAFDRRFQKIVVSEPSYSEVIKIIKAVTPFYERFYNVSITREVIDKIVKLSSECVFNGKQPDKAIDLLDSSLAYCLLNNDNVRFLSDLDNKINMFLNKKNEEIVKRNFKKAKYYRAKENSYRQKYDNILLEENSIGQIKLLPSHVEKTVYQKQGVVPKDLYCSILDSFILNNGVGKIYAQADAVKQIGQYLKKYDFIARDKPLSILLMGNHGVGKSYLVEKLVKIFEKKINCIEVNMCDCQTLSGFYKFLDFSNSATLFTTINDTPMSFLFFDNIDYASSDLMDYIVQAINSGYLDNKNGDKIFLNKCIIFFSVSEIGKGCGFVSSPKDSFYDNFVSSVDYIVKLSDISEKNVILYLKEKYPDLKDNDIKYVVNNSQYKEYGFSKITKVLKNKFSDLKIKT